MAYFKDVQNKVKRAMEYHGPRYIEIDTPCPAVWGFPPDRTLEVGRPRVGGENRRITGAIVFLASAASDFVHGAVLPLDGGLLGRLRPFKG